MFAKGGEGGLDLAERLVKLLEEQKSDFKPLYDEKLPIKEKIEKIVREIYGGRGAVYSKKAEKEIKHLEELGLDKKPVCIAKTQYSLSDDASKRGRPSDFDVYVARVRVSNGAGFIVCEMGDIMVMPGLPKLPAAERIDIDADGTITGLF